MWASPSCSRLKGLLKLNVGHTRLTDGQFVTLSTKLSELTELNINSDAMSDAGLAGLANLRKVSKLNIHARMCTDLGLGYVRRLANLQAHRHRSNRNPQPAPL